jgi:hypothetical protein
MCTFGIRVSSCGHYKATLKEPCDEAKENQTPCDIGSSSEDASTTGGLSGCDKKPAGKREGPGTSKLVAESILLNATGNRSNGGFDPDDVDWSEF